MPEQSPGLKEAVRQMSEARHGDSAMFYAGEVLSLIEAHHHIVRLSNTKVPGLTDDALAQRKALLQIPAKIVRQEAQRVFNDYFIPEFNRWLEATK